jgi:hypothetical protein
MLRIDRLLPALQFALEGAHPGEVTLKEPGLEPAVEVFDAALALGSGRWNEHRLDLEAQAQANDPRQIAGGGSPTEELAGIVELDLNGAT